MSALPPKADICRALADVRFGPKADSCSAGKEIVIRSPRRIWRPYSTQPGAREAPLRRLEINLNHGAAWKALISRYITVILLIGDDSCIAMQSMSGWPLKKSVHNAMMAN